MTTRVGKIARVPHLIREELNHRIENGELGIKLVPWLNALPEVQRIMAEQFGGRPISKQNLSEWKNGGYPDWVRNRDTQNELREMMEEARQLDQAGASKNGGFVGYLGTFLVVELAEAIDNLHKTKNPADRLKIFRKLSRELSRLRTDHSRERRLELRALKAPRLSEQFQAVQT
jgi:hypothetical protein